MLSEAPEVPEDDHIPPPRPYGPRRRVGEPRSCRWCSRPVNPSSRSHVCAACAKRKARGQELVYTGPERRGVRSPDRRRVDRRT